MNILCTNIEINYELISKILSYNIIDLDDIALEFKKDEKNILIDVYEENNVEDTINYDSSEEINIKFNKKIKLLS